MEKTEHDMTTELAPADSTVAITVRCKRRPRYIRAGIAFPFGTSHHRVTREQLQRLLADRSGALAISLAQTAEADDAQAPVADGQGPDIGHEPDSETSHSEQLLDQDKRARLLALIQSAPEEAPRTGDGRLEVSWLKSQLGEPVTAAERDAVLSMMSVGE